MSLRIRRSVLAVILVGFAVRALALWAAADVVPVLDERSYALRAEALLDGQGFLGSYQSWVRHPGQRHDPPQYPGAWQPPGQSAFMAAVMALSGRSLLAVKWAQVLLGTLSVGLIFALGRAWFDARSGLAAAWIFALYPNLIAFTHYLWSETLFVVLLLAGLWVLTRRPEPPVAGSALLAGVFLGLAALTRSLAAAFLPLLVVWLLWAHRRRPRAAWTGAGLLLLAAGLVILPWSLRNTRLHGGFVLIETNGPYNLWRGNGPDTFAGRDDATTPRYGWPFESLPLAPVANRTPWRLVDEAKQALGSDTPSDLQIVGYARSSAWQQIRDEPATFLARVPIRMLDLWNPTSFLVRHLRLGAYGEVSPALQGTVTLLAVVAYLLLMGLGCAGLWSAGRRPEAWLVLLFAALTAAVAGASFGLTRFRLPLMPLLAVLAGPVVLRLLRRAPPAARGSAALLALLPLFSACGDRPATPAQPNVLWVVWDTVRADRMSLYGHPRDTTPRLDAWAQGARVFENVVSTAGYTLPSHASLFTGLLPSEHCTHNDHPQLDDRFTTVAELLNEAGYRTFLFSANPHIAAGPGRGFGQGFETVEHPWSERYRADALELVKRKLPPEDRSSELPQRLAAAADGGGLLTAWNIKAAGELAERATLEWLEASDGERPWFVFLNYMEAHRPYIPPRRYRELTMSGDQVLRSYQVDRSWLPIWEYTFGLRDYSDEELELTRATYDATLRELDDLFADLLEALETRGDLDDTVVILTSDHGEHLGEQHMLDHQYSLYEPLLRVPLVIHYPARFPPGRDRSPVVHFDLFPTVLELADVDPPDGLASQAVSLLSPQGSRLRLAEDPSGSKTGIAQVLAAHPEWDPGPYKRRLRALFASHYKYLWGSDGRNALYDLDADPRETTNRLGTDAATARRLEATLSAYTSGLAHCDPAIQGEAPPLPSPDERRLLESLGYLAPEAETADE